ncbi:MAG: YcxB family protein, partial [Candidatus Heimdallarchaeota archaeon]
NVDWTFIHKVVEQREAFLFYFNTMEYRIVPKRVMDPNQIASLRNIFYTSIGSKYRTQRM